MEYEDIDDAYCEAEECPKCGSYNVMTHDKSYDDYVKIQGECTDCGRQYTVTGTLK